MVGVGGWEGFDVGMSFPSQRCPCPPTTHQPSHSPSRLSSQARMPPPSTPRQEAAPASRLPARAPKTAGHAPPPAASSTAATDRGSRCSNLSRHASPPCATARRAGEAAATGPATVAGGSASKTETRASDGNDSSREGVRSMTFAGVSVGGGMTGGRRDDSHIELARGQRTVEREKTTSFAARETKRAFFQSACSARPSFFSPRCESRETQNTRSTRPCCERQPRACVGKHRLRLARGAHRKTNPPPAPSSHTPQVQSHVQGDADVRPQAAVQSVSVWGGEQEWRQRQKRGALLSRSHQPSPQLRRPGSRPLHRRPQVRGRRVQGAGRHVGHHHGGWSRRQPGPDRGQRVFKARV